MSDCTEILMGLGILNEIMLKLDGPEKILEIMNLKSKSSDKKKFKNI